ncbi:MAG TPA: hypothetical protein VKM55_04025 [Candidatus Lokiarchaeia archaeon]|nr:hypothetical protein [Candidatus Lokiarchaeia archaeon]
MKIHSELAIDHALLDSFHPGLARENETIRAGLQGSFSVKYIEHRTAKIKTFPPR